MAEGSRRSSNPSCVGLRDETPGAISCPGGRLCFRLRVALDCFAANTFDGYTQAVPYVFFLLAGAMAATSLAEGEGAPSSRQAEHS